MPSLRLSLVDGQRVVDSVNGQEITLTALVEGITINPGDNDATVLSRCLPILPTLYSPHYDSVNCPFATLRDRHVISRRSFTSVLIALIYRAPGTSQFVLEEISQADYLKSAITASGYSTVATSDTTQNIEVWFDVSGDNTATTIPSTISPRNPQRFCVEVPRFSGKRIIRATGWMLFSDWEMVRPKIRAAWLCTNSSQWGDDTVQDATGCWLFQALTNRTSDLNITKEIEIYFIQQQFGHYPIAEWTNYQGFHEIGGVTAQQLIAQGPPPVMGFDAVGGIVRTFRGQWQMNGRTRAAVYPEVDFNSLFTFSPSDA